MGPNELPGSTREALRQLRYLEPPPDLLAAVVREVEATPQQRRHIVTTWRLIVAIAAAVSIVVIAVLPQLWPYESVVGPRTASQGTTPTDATRLPIGGAIDVRIRVPDGAHTGSVDADSIWLGSEGSGRVLRMDPETGGVAGEVQVNEPTDAPYDLWPISDGTSVWAAGRDDRALVQIDIGTLQVTARTPVELVAYRIQPAGRVVWATGFADDRVVAVDTGTGDVIGEVRVASPTGVAVTPTAVYVATYDGALVVVDPGTFRIVARHTLLAKATDLAVSDGAIFIWGRDGRPLERFDAGSARVTTSHDAVTGLAVIGDDVWTATANGVVRVDPTTLEPLFAVAFDGAGTDQLVAGPNHLWAYAQVGDATYLYGVTPNT